MVLTWVLPTGLEDVLAASLAGLAGYVALLNLPLKRGQAKAKLQQAADEFLRVSCLGRNLHVLSRAGNGKCFSCQAGRARAHCALQAISQSCWQGSADSLLCSRRISTASWRQS